jgi:mycothiol system anti-sigma-R factor
MDMDAQPDEASPSFQQLFGGGDCTDALNTLYHFLDGELTPERRRAIQRHLEQCSPCLAAYDFEAELKLVVARCCREEHVPESLKQRIADVLAWASQTGSGLV